MTRKHTPRSETAMRAPSPQSPGMKVRLEEKLGLLDDLRIVGYAGHGTDTALHVEGRLLERDPDAGDPAEAGVWESIKATFHRLDSDEIPGARVRVRFRDGEWDAWTDNEGYFTVSVPLAAPLEPGWHEVHLRIVSSVKADDFPSTTAPILVPSPDAEFGVVSDLDDTVVQSSATDLLRNIQVLFAGDASTRSPFAGVADFYHALVAGPDDRGVNPIFYVSRSGWNQYDLFVNFFEEQGIPRGPIYLQDLALRESKSSAIGNEQHKRDRILRLLESYPRLPFVLIGDSGQEDPETYRMIVHQRPGRIRAVYIRDVSPDDSRDERVKRIARELTERGTPTALVSTSAEAAEHAAAHGLVSRQGLERVRRSAGDAPESENQV